MAGVDTSSTVFGTELFLQVAPAASYHGVWSSEVSPIVSLLGLCSAQHTLRPSIPSNNSPADTPNAFASFDMVRAPGSRSLRSILAT